MIIQANITVLGRPRQVYRDTRTGRFAARADFQDQESARQAEERRRLEARPLGRATRHLVWSTGSAPWPKPIRHLTPTERRHVERGQLFTMPLSKLAARHRERFLTGR